ncbi:hypothetical protein GQ53DRAFT_781165 [Thozetella sp. PMI_491]|nr:hypothetical protein GQ53DRAFT_781165 [Thozetella sp. PMI_491]
MVTFLFFMFVHSSMVSWPLGCKAGYRATPTAPTSAAPQATPYDWTPGAVSAYPIPPSCNYTERAQLQRGINDAITLAAHARDHISRFGNSSQFYSKYFGQAPSAEAVADGHAGRGGHWRGENAADETPLEAMCGFGYTVAVGALNFYLGSDLIHRLYHLPKIGEAIVEHYADSYGGCKGCTGKLKTTASADPAARTGQLTATTAAAPSTTDSAGK